MSMHALNPDFRHQNVYADFHAFHSCGDSEFPLVHYGYLEIRSSAVWKSARHIEHVKMLQRQEGSVMKNDRCPCAPLSSLDTSEHRAKHWGSSLTRQSETMFTDRFSCRVILFPRFDWPAI